MQALSNTMPLEPSLPSLATNACLAPGTSGADDGGATTPIFAAGPSTMAPGLNADSVQQRNLSMSPRTASARAESNASDGAFEHVQRADRPNLKRKRRSPSKTAQQPECAFHRSDDAYDDAEELIQCPSCERYGHPSCLQVDDLRDVISTYDWKCVDCKACEVCKKNDERVIICEHCDRAWHSACLDPPLDCDPEGEWTCPLCSVEDAGPSLIAEASEDPNGDADGDGEYDDAVVTELDEPAVVPVKKPKRKRTDRDRERDRARRARNKSMGLLASGAPRKKSKVKLTVHPPAPPPKVMLRIPVVQREKEQQSNEPPPNPFEEVLGPEDRDTSKTSIMADDKARFERSRLAAEAKLPPPISEIPSTPPEQMTPIAGPSTFSLRPLRSQSHLLVTSTPVAISSTPGHVTPGGVQTNPGADGLRIKALRFGDFDIDTWYDAPFPEEYSNLPESRLWMCEFCLKYMKSKFSSDRHRLKCKTRHPPGDEIYRDGNISVFEVDGRRNKIYCQNLCMLSKMFLYQKSLFYDVEPFLFYVMTEVDEHGAHFVGYFSKEKCSPKNYNLSCIMTLPVRQRKGWGQFLIDFSYLLSKKEARTGTPERPLSHLGALSYKNYWTLAVFRFLEIASSSITLEDISTATGITIEDVYTTLRDQNMIASKQLTPVARFGTPVKPVRGRQRPHSSRRSVARRQSSAVNATRVTPEPGDPPPVVIPKEYDITWEKDEVVKFLEKWRSKGYLVLKPERLEWSPYLLSREAREAALADREIQTHTTDEDPHRGGSALDDFAELALAKRSEEKQKQVDEDHALAEKIAATEGFAQPGRIRRTRSSGLAPTLSVPAEPTSPSPIGSRTRNAGQRRRPVPVRTTRSSAATRNDDQEGGRTLRSHVPSSPDVERDERSSSPPIRPPRASSPRKRRRIESDPPTTPSSAVGLELGTAALSTASASTHDGTGTPPLGHAPVPVVGVVEDPDPQPFHAAAVVTPTPQLFSFKPSPDLVSAGWNVSATRQVREDTPTEMDETVVDPLKKGIGDMEEWDDDADAEGEEDPDV